MAVPDNTYFMVLESMRGAMEKYNAELIRAFETYLATPSARTIGEVMKLREKEISRSAGNVYGYVNYLHIISDLAAKEIENGFTPLTDGSRTYEEAVDRYHRIVFMKRRSEFMDDENMIRESWEYMIKNRISPVTLSYIINEEYGTDSSRVPEHWIKVYSDNGLIREADMLKKLSERK